MKKYYVSFTTKDGDYSTEWCHADSIDEAEDIIRNEHWDIDEIVQVKEAR